MWNLIIHGKCPRCEETKPVMSGFHKGVSLCKECKNKDNRTRKALAISNRELYDLVEKMASTMDKMVRALERHDIRLSDDEEKDKKSERKI